MKDQSSFIKELSTFRKTLHQYPEVAGEEQETAKRVVDFVKVYEPDEVISQIGGHGVAFVFKGEKPGKNTLIRAELDALPIKEANDFDHQSRVVGKSHKCGHDGHMVMVAGLAKQLQENRPKRGNVILLFQPAEETGQGAQAMVVDEQFSKLQPDYAFALHNLPGYPTGQVLLKQGAFAAASRGMKIYLKGNTSHAAHPEDGNSPALAMSQLIVGLEKLPDAFKKFALVTVIHAQLGEVAFGTTPGEAVVMATLRSFDDDTMAKLVNISEELARRICREKGLEVSFEYVEDFSATINDAEAQEILVKAAKDLSIDTRTLTNPFRWSEDFGRFSQVAKTAMFGLGAGEKTPQLHDSAYDFPDELIPTGLSVFSQVITSLHY